MFKSSSTHSVQPGLVPDAALGGSLRDYRSPEGVDLLERVGGFFKWQDLRRSYNLWPYAKSTATAPKTHCSAKNDRGDDMQGVNFASQDYLSLASHPEVKAAAIEAVHEYGVHSAGSAALLGNTRQSLQLERAISDFVNGREVVLYPTGWSAGFAAVQGIVRANDHVVMDVLAHSCLQEGARAATQNIHFHGHLNIEGLARRLQRIRANDTQNGILVVTESLFSMHSDTPDIAALRAVCDQYDAKLLVDCAHDFGCIGEDGLGHLGLQNVLDQVDVIIGSFSKTFASNGGFIAVKSRAVAEYLKYFSATQTFSNALSPIQAAVVLKSLEIVPLAGRQGAPPPPDGQHPLHAQRDGQGRPGGARRSVGHRAGASRRRGACPYRLARADLARRHRQPRRVSGRAAGRRPLPRAGHGRPYPQGCRHADRHHAAVHARCGSGVPLLPRAGWRGFPDGEHGRRPQRRMRDA